MNVLIKKGICDDYTHTHTYIKCCLVMIFCQKRKERPKSFAAFPESTTLDSSLDVAGQEIFFQDFVM
jgi:hypothetical protein